MMTPADRVAINELLLPIGPKLWVALTRAVNDCGMIQELLGRLLPRTRANLVWDRANTLFLAEVARQPDVRRIGRDPQTAFYEVGGRVVIRIKQIAKDGRIKATRTGQSDVYYGQGMLFEDTPSCLNLVAAFSLDASATKVQSVCWAMCEPDGSIAWKWDIQQPTASVQRLHDAPGAPAPAAVRAKITLPQRGVVDEK